MQSLDTIHQYLERHSEEIGNRILASYPALYGADEAPSPLLSRMARVPYPAQSLAIMGVSKRWQLARNASVVAEWGSGNLLNPASGASVPDRRYAQWWRSDTAAWHQ